MNEKEIGEAMRKKRGDKGLRETAREANIQPHQIVSIEQATKAYTLKTLEYVTMSQLVYLDEVEIINIQERRS